MSMHEHEAGVRAGRTHSLAEIFRRADEMSYHPLHWPWGHWYFKGKGGYMRRARWIAYRVRNWWRNG